MHSLALASARVNHTAIAGSRSEHAPHPLTGRRSPATFHGGRRRPHPPRWTQGRPGTSGSVFPRGVVKTSRALVPCCPAAKSAGPAARAGAARPGSAMRSRSSSTACAPMSSAGTSAAVSGGRKSSAQCLAATPAMEKSLGTTRPARSSARWIPGSAASLMVATAVTSGRSASSSSMQASPAAASSRAAVVAAVQAALGDDLRETAQGPVGRAVPRGDELGRAVDQRDVAVAEVGQVVHGTARSASRSRRRPSRCRRADRSGRSSRTAGRSVAAGPPGRPPGGSP